MGGTPLAVINVSLVPDEGNSTRLIPDLRVIQIKAAPSGATTPMPPGHAPEPLGKGPGGTTVTEVTNLWRGQWGVKGVNDIDWGVGRECADLIHMPLLMCRDVE